MLEAKDLIKVYKPKKGVPVTALDKVTLKFPDKGMIFLLGKSGSGKSTLLNVLGGLDNYNGGEIIIKGVSSKDFKQKHFDSYRNTYVGFIFQEYNVLDEFTVGANIALAIELQGRKAQDSEINDILKRVDLEGYGSRKPNELSGGQKQRVAIARALVKNPQIIMADEPTGALDSNTGKAIFDTLKKLSSDKLVIVVSHDREFAESYADRIIELSDGKVISDIELSNEPLPQEEKPIYNGEIIDIPKDYTLTEQDRQEINEYIKNLSSGVRLKLSAANSGKKFVPTDTSKIVQSSSGSFKLIKSKLPIKNAFKIGGSSLKYKKIRLAITIILSCIAFGLFGLADTFGAYNHVESCTNSLVDSGVKYVATAKSKRIDYDNYSYWQGYGFYLSDKEIKEISKNTGVTMHGVYYPIDANLNFGHHISSDVVLSETEFNIYNTDFNGFATINESVIDDMGFSVLAGKLPDGGKNEIAVSEYVLEVFKKGGYHDGKFDTSVNDPSKQLVEIKTADDLIGKVITMGDTEYTVTAVIDTNFDLERYVPLTEEQDYVTATDQILDYVLFNEFSYTHSYSYSGLAMVGDGYLENLISKRPNVANITEGYIWFNANGYDVDSNYLAKLSDIDKGQIVWLDGQREVLGEKEIIATSDAIHPYEETELYENETERCKSILNKSNTLDSWQDLYSSGTSESVSGYKIVGFIPTDNVNCNLASTVVCSDSLFNKFTDGSDSYYSFCVGAMPESKSDIKELVSYCYDENDKIRYPIQNSVTYELDAVNEFLKEAANIFLYIGLGFALFAALMLANFIGTSISYKKQEIGILRAIGSRSNDVFRIFFCESFIIAMINFLLSAVGVAVATTVINHIIRERLGILVTILNFDLRQIVLLLAVSILVAFAASYIPVKRIASKRPIDAIRDR